jgi:N-acetylneuraminic acid mutarotase
MGTGLVLADNGTDLLRVPNNGPFTFATAVSGGGAYNVTVRTPPTNPSQTCTVAGGSGQAAAGNVTGVRVTCLIDRYTVGGAVSGLASGRSLVLQDNGGDNLTLTQSGTFAFATKVANGSAYGVVVLTQPAGQNCTVTLGSGTMPANDVGAVAVNCSARIWTWLGGSSAANATGAYGTLGLGSTTNVPGARSGATSWSDQAGNLWLFGGSGYDSTGTGGTLNDLWEYTPSSQQWTWMGGADTGYGFEIPSGVYGTRGVAAATNVPPARTGAVSWTDNAGNLWMFGGLPNDTGLPLNDLWKYTPATQQWTWMGGANTVGAAGAYGTLGVGSTDNAPGAHQDAASWTDKEGNFWLFGGQGNDAAQAFGLLGDLWKFTPSTQQWAWMGGANTADPEGNALGSYGTLGVASATNFPGERSGAATWTDDAGNLWLFGGSLLYSNGQLNDLWKFTPSTGQWIWMSGANTVNEHGTYGTPGVGSKTNVPGARFRPIAWT